MKGCRKVKKAFTTILCLLLAAVMLAGCNSTASNGGESSDPANTASDGGADSTPTDTVSTGVALNTACDFSQRQWAFGTLDIYTTQTTASVTKKTAANTVVIAGSTSIDACDPVKNAGYIWANNVYETLFTYDFETGELYGLLATDWGYDEDGNFRITLRDGVKFHDGTTLDADDVLFTFERLANTSSSSGKAAFQNIDYEQSYAEDSLHVVLVMKSECGSLVNYIASGYAGIMSKEFCEAKGDDYGFLDGDAGTGAYYLTETVTGISQTFQRFDDYWGDQPEVETVIYRLYKDYTAMFIDYENGDLDVLLKTNFDSVSRILTGEVLNTVMYTAPADRVQILSFSTIGTALEDSRVRQALSLAMSTSDMIIGAYGDEIMATPAYSILPLECKYYTNVGEHVQDIDQAKALLEDAGYNESNPLTLTCLSTNNVNSYALAQVFQGALEKIGVTLTIQEIQSSEIAKYSTDTTVPATFDMIIGANPVGTRDPDEYLAPRAAYGLEIGTFSGNKGLSDQKISELIVQGGLETDEDERAAIYKEIQEIFNEECYLLPICLENNYIVARSWVGGINFPSIANISFKTLTLSE